ncbi:MAG: LamG domain-containing protein, partial [Candidatus Kariarchaeaceae archaeon]
MWHLSESSGNAKDSSSYSTDGTLSGGITQGTSGQMGNSYYFDRDSIGTVNMGDPSDGHLDFGNGDDFSISFWINLDYFYYYSPFVVSKRSSGSSSSQGYSVQLYDEAHGIPFYEISSNGPEYEVDGTNDCLAQGWKYVVAVWDENNIQGCKVYLDGSDETSSRTGTIGSIDDISNNVNFKLNGPSSPNTDYMFDGKLDEVRVSSIARSSNWIATEYNNQYNPRSFLTLRSEQKYDKTPPTYSNVTESSDPLELGDMEVITLNVTDSSGINQVKLEFEGSNHSMTNIGGDIWGYDSWNPNSVDNYTYTIWMEDNYSNWNSTSGIIEVIDTTSPTYSDLIESADPLQLGQNETISIKVYDSPGSGVNQTLLEYDFSNHTMIFMGGNTWNWDKWNPSSLGDHSYTIYMQDMENNWNITSGSITVVSTTAPVIENLTKSEDPLELGNNITITIDVF